MDKDTNSALTAVFGRASEISELRRKNYPSTLNDRIVVRANDELKAAFEHLCSASGHKPSAAIRMLMLKSIRDWKINA
ncbi:hypothetical protein K0819_08140 [Vibrio parahaemolyticus]|uniref:hypothetical protein n=1 Tax=Vibrio parahaemolyticus TaxID=670 RepID=UPI0018699FB3|nr:hypothetical protein [Vibrio parahaemolyticus]MBE3884816.1 hypothetical protein [Vibrio parahaemolyticus]WCM66888.1 hypothetical protein K0819_08040 [Vibrio parahaemolyticus]WCM66890.1 hypothetical protein K0819_08050 [Vibrio parahaemolyticus]WCM66892.1 hypothetical protein K0819_08060 [Vibrio parahaemolyticus]WCM66894.1 hypothetical protein K0819_08070 [Vibrio parahaemolyticus]